MSKYIETTTGENFNIIWISGSEGETYGICTHDQTILDSYGIPSGEQEMGADIFTALENCGFEIEQDWDNEQTFIELEGPEGNYCRLVFSGTDVEIVKA